MERSVTMRASITEKFSKLIKKNNYEPILCELMNISTLVFPGRYYWNIEQSSGECDFVEVGTGAKFDAKLPFRSKYGKLVGSNNHDFKKWIELMIQQETEFGEDIVETRDKNIASMELYKIMKCRLEDVEADEHAIFFFPYPIVLDCKELKMVSLISDYLDAIFRELSKNNIVGSRKIYAIYPAADRHIVLRCLNDNKREFVKFSKLDEFIAYDFSCECD